MEYYCETCDKYIKPKSSYKHFISNTLKDSDKCKHVKLAIENPDLNNIDEIFYANNIEHIKKCDYCLMKCEFNLIFNDKQYRPYLTS